MKKKVLLTSIATIALCLCLIAGSTFALFTSQSQVNIAVTAGKVEVVANISDLTLYSAKANLTSGTVTDEYGYKYDYEKQNTNFVNGGTATLVGNELTLDKVTPGDKVTFTIEIANASDVATQYRTLVYCTANDGLLGGLEIGLDGDTFNGFAYTEWTALASGADIQDVAVTVELPVSAGNEYQATSASLCFVVEAVQSNGAITYDYLPDLDADGAYEIANAADLFIFASKVNDGTFAKGELTADIDLAGKVWMPIVHSDVEFDGQGHTISNLYVLDNKAAGLFGYATRSTISNVVIDNATVISNHYAAGIAAHALCTKIDNCTVKNSNISTSAEWTMLDTGKEGWDNGDKAGAIAGYLSAEPNATVTNCTVENVTVKGYRDIGGVVGYANAEATITGNTVSDSTIICDVAHNYKNYTATEEFDVEAIVGEVKDGTVDASNVATNVNVEAPTTVSFAATQEELNTADIKNNSVVYLESGSYVIPASAKGKTLTIVGNGENSSVAVTKVGVGGENCDFGLDGSTVVFENITIATNSSTYIGYARCNATYNNCTFDGTYTLYGDSVFNNCTFNVSGDVYNIWTWGAPTATFNNCTFNSDGKAMLLYGQANTKLTLNGCTFNDNGGLTDLKAAVEIGNDYNKSYELFVNDTIVNGYEINDKGINTGTTLWANKNSMGTDKLNVVVDGVDVY